MSIVTEVERSAPVQKQEVKHIPLRDVVRDAIQKYLQQLGNEEPNNMYDLVLSEIEVPLFRMMMNYTNNNQSKAAIILGISRGTLRKKLKIYGLL